MDPRKWSVGQWAAAIVLLLVWLADSVTAAVDADLLTPEFEIWALKIAATLGLLSRRIGVLAERLASFGGNGPGSGGPKTADGKPMRYDVPLSLLALCFVPLLGACGVLSQQQRDTLRRESPCIAANAALEAIPRLVPFCNGDEACLTGLDVTRAAAMETAKRECESESETQGERDAEAISRKNRPLLRARLGSRAPETARGDHYRRTQRHQGPVAHVRSAYGAVRRARRGADAGPLELAAAGVGEERG